jgi:hypothetical protein
MIFFPFQRKLLPRVAYALTAHTAVREPMNDTSVRLLVRSLLQMGYLRVLSILVYYYYYYS